MDEKKLIPADELKYLTICATKLSRLVELIPTIEAGKATGDQTTEATETAKYLLKMDMCAGAGEVCGHIRDALEPLTLDRFLAQRFGENWQREQAELRRAEAADRHSKDAPTWDDTFRSGRF